MQSKVFYIRANRGEENQVLAKKAEKIFLSIGLREQIEKDSFVALKIHFGEKNNTGFIKPQWIVGVITQIRSITPRVFWTDTNTLYRGGRSNSVEHTQLAVKHGFSPENGGVPVIIADGLIGRDDEEIQINLPQIKTAKLAKAILDTNVLVCLNHFTGHGLTGFGGAIKNLGMGCASRAGKLEQHSDVHPWINKKVCNNCGICLDYCPADAIFQKEGSVFILQEKCIGCGECLVICNVGAVKFRWDLDSVRVQEKMSEYAYSVLKHFDGKIGFLSFLLKVTKDCDCMAKDDPAIVEDVGILGSLDPVAIDKASVDMVLDKNSTDILRAGYDLDWSIQLKHGVKIGLGSMEYELIELT